MNKARTRWNGHQVYLLDKIETVTHQGEVINVIKQLPIERKKEPSPKREDIIPPWMLEHCRTITDYRNLENGIDIQEQNQKKFNKLMRLYRYRMKALNDDFNYFVTITYDDKKTTSEAFHKDLLKSFYEIKRNDPNFRYIGAFEHGGKGDRLHFHGILNIKPFAPILVDNYNQKNGIMFTWHNHPYFLSKFGLCNFSPINKETFDYPHTIRYITKYMMKEGAFCEIHLSRGIKDYNLVDINGEEFNDYQYIPYAETYVKGKTKK